MLYNINFVGKLIVLGESKEEAINTAFDLVGGGCMIEYFECSKSSFWAEQYFQNQNLQIINLNGKKYKMVEVEE